MNLFYPLKIADVRRETHDTVSIAFDVPVGLKATYAFCQGQYLNLQTRLSGKIVCRSYSIHSSPGSGELRVAIKHVQGGQFSTFATTGLSRGDTLEVSPPQGGLALAPQAGDKRHYLGVAAGSGITALMPLLESILDNELASSFTLLYGARTRAEMLFRKQLELRAGEYADRLRLVLLFSRESRGEGPAGGRLDTRTCDDLFNSDIDVTTLGAAFICGPQAMMDTVRHSLLKAGLEASKIHANAFSGTALSAVPDASHITA